MPAFDPIDDWFEKGFRVRKTRSSRPTREAQRSSAGPGLSSTKGAKVTKAARVKNAVSVARKAPEVMVKITGSSSGMSTVKHHLDYISRNGDVELTDETGSTINGKQAVNDLRANYKAAQIPEDSKRREFLHVIFSMPAGTAEREFRAAVMDYCKEEFANRRYVAAFHDDTDHTHMHVCINTRDIDRSDAPRLSPRKADLFRWRQGFAEKLRENGIDAAASERKHRFNYRKPESTKVRQIRAANPQSPMYKPERAKERAMQRQMNAVLKPEKAFVGPLRQPKESFIVQAQGNALRAAMAANQRPTNPAADAIEKSKAHGLKVWAEVARNLREEGQSDLASDVDDLMTQGQQPTKSRSQELFDLAMNQVEKSRDQDRER